MKPIRVELGDRSYPICFGSLAKPFPRQLRAQLPRLKNVLIVTSQAVASAGHLRRLQSALKILGIRHRTVVLPNGESHKNLDMVSRLYREGLLASLDRTSAIVGLGGGVITDMAGFAAATYMRGIPFVSIPTTVLGMVDAAIGGKTGVDVSQGKNLVGAFWQPSLVWIDPSVLKSLPPREWRTGFAEVIKYGVIKEAAFFAWLETRIHKNPKFWTWPPADLAHILYISARCKARVVSADERETPLGGGREILNFGHTTGHALEAAARYRGLSHGEAISIGMVVAGRLALKQSLWSQKEHDRMRALLKAAGLPIEFPKLSPSGRRMFWLALQKDKKHVAGRMRFVLPVRLGRVDVKEVTVSQRSFV